MKTLAKTLGLTLAAAAIAATAVTPASANPAVQAPDGRMVATIATGDLNLATPEGQRQLDKRVDRAVRQVCRTVHPATGTRIMNQDQRDCLANARSSAKQQVAALIAAEQRGG